MCVGEGRKIDISEKVSRKKQEKSGCLKPSLKALACHDIEFGFYPVVTGRQRKI